jgi:ankyrin repeat protein
MPSALIMYRFADHGAGASGRLLAQRSDRRDILRLLLARGADIQQRGLNDRTPLHYAVNLDDGEAIELLLAHGADIDARTRIDDCSTPVEKAESHGRSAAIRAFRRIA